MAFIEISHVTKVFGRRPEQALRLLAEGMSKERLLADTGHVVALRDVSLSIEQGKIFVVMGLSGSGKSTLIRHINRLIDPTAGSISIDGTDILGLSIPDLICFRRKRLAMVFQHFALLPHRTVLENVAYGLELQRVRRAVRTRKAEEWIAAVGLSGFERKYPFELSGGMQQRVGLARALCVDHDIILMDEAFSALDPLIRSQMQDLLMSLQTRLKKTIVFITHDLDEALRLGDTITILRDGEVVQVGGPVEILLHPADDYVSAFVKDVNRARALTVQAVMRPAPVRLSAMSPEAALAAIEERGVAIGYFVDGEATGVVTKVALRAAIAGAKPPATIAGLAIPVMSVAPQSSLGDALPAALSSPFPVPVVNGEGTIVGVLPSDRLAEVLRAGGAVAGTGDKREAIP